MADIPKPETISTKQQTIAAQARQAPEMSFTSLNHYIDLDWLREAYRRTRKDGAVGVDNQTAEAYAEHLEENLQDLLNRAKSGLYRAPAVRRAHIPKSDGSSTRPIGIPTFEDKVLNGRWSWCSNRSTSRTFGTARTGFDLVGLRIRRYRPGKTSSYDMGADGSWSLMSSGFSIRWTARISVRFCAVGCVTAYFSV